MTRDDLKGPQRGDASDLRPLAELPSLRLAAGARDLRGWHVQDADGKLLGTVRDLLADPDRLVAEFLLVSTRADSGEAIMALSGMEIRDSHLVPGSGPRADPPPISIDRPADAVDGGGGGTAGPDLGDLVVRTLTASALDPAPVPPGQWPLSM
jgi:hypothetical protein